MIPPFIREISEISGQSFACAFAALCFSWITRATRTTCAFHPAKRALFGSKSGVPAEIFDTFFRVFSRFWDLFRRKELSFNHKRRSNPSKKNRAEKPTVGFCFFPACATISARTMKHGSKLKDRSSRATFSFVLFANFVVKSGCRAVVSAGDIGAWRRIRGRCK